MKKILLLFCAMLTCVGMSAKDVYDFVLGEELTLEQVKDGTTPFILARVKDGKVLVYGTGGNMAATKTPNEAGVSTWAYYFKMEAIAGNQTYEDNLTAARNATENPFNGEATNDDLYLFRVYANATTPWNLWGNNQMFMSHCGWTMNSNNLNGTKFGSDAYYNAIWKVSEESDGYSIQSQSIDNKKYVSGSGGPGDKTSWKFYASLESKKVGHTTFDLTKISFEDAKNSTDPVVLIQNDLVLCNSNDGANYSSKEEFDQYAYWVKFEDYNATDNQYYITLNKEDGSRVNYLNASVWSHVFLSGVDKAGTNGEKQNGAVFTIADLGDNKYSISNLGASEGAYGEEYINKNYVKFTTDGYWKNNATWQHESVGEWEFYTVTNMQTVPDEPDGGWTCPEGEVDYTTLDGFKDVNNVGTPLNGGEVVYGDQSNGDRYTDVTKCEVVKFYGTPGALLRVFANREGGSGVEVGKTEQRITINAEGVGVLNVADVMAATEKNFCHLSGIKIAATWQGASVDQNIVIDGITVVMLPEPDYTISTTTGKIGTIALDYPASIEGATLYEVVGFSTTDGLYVAEVEGDMVGGTPYIYQATADEVACYKKGDAVGHGDFDCTHGSVGNGLVGCYSQVSPSTWWAGFIKSSYIISNGKLRQIANGKITIPANRCFFDPSKCTNNNAAGVKMQLGFAEDVTSISNVNAALEDGKIYDLNGREVKSMKKGGIYIMGGMKVSVK